MRSLLATISGILRVSLLAFLALGVVAKPMLAAQCDIHAQRHLLDASLQSRNSNDVVHQVDRDHAGGAHERLHESDAGAVYVDNLASLELPACTFDAVAVTTFVPAALPPSLFGTPFRPPTA